MTRRLGIITALALLGGFLLALAALADEEEERNGAPTTHSRSLPNGTTSSGGSHWTLVGWNDLGMHCTDGNDFSIFAVLPPFNTIHAHLIDSYGKLVKNPSGITVTYEAFQDPGGSINKSSIGKTNLWQFVPQLFGINNLAPDVGLKGFAMPGARNTPQKMSFESGHNWFTAEGVPITPYDDGGVKNYYPMMQLAARDRKGTLLASTRIVLPVSDEMDCKACHLSGSNAAAMPAAGWVNFTADMNKDVKLNILKIHDDRQAGPGWPSLLQSVGYNSLGLYATAVSGSPVLCYRCHTSNAFPGLGVSTLKPLTEAVHGKHAAVIDPANNMPMNSDSNRTSCYRCHPGSATKCLRGAMGKAIASDGSQAMQCQSCHGSMDALAVSGRQGWLEEPACQSCHTGTAVSNNGQIRYTSVFDGASMRQAVNTTFATTPDVPGPGLSLFRFSQGHGGLQCEACHGSPHAIFPTSHRNDNIQNTELQGHLGTLVECTACHASQPATASGGPHGMHPVGQSWVAGHHDAFEHDSPGQCASCHGGDYRGTVLSRSHADRTIQTEFGTKYFWRGFQIGCYACHNGPNSSDPSRNRPPAVQSASISTFVGLSKSLNLSASDPDKNSLALRIVSQPDHGAVALQNNTAIYNPDPGFQGSDKFTFAAWDGYIDSNLGTVTVTVQ